MLTISTRFAALFVLLALTAPTPLHADGAADSTAAAPELIDTDRPDVTNGSSRLDPGVVQLETGWSRTSQDRVAQTSWGDALLRIGVSRAFELRLFTPGVEQVTFHGHSDEGWGEMGVGFKLGATSSDGNRGVAIVANGGIPAAHPLRSTDAVAVLAGDLGLAGFGASANLGVHRFSSDRDSVAATSWLASLSIARELTQRVSVLAELAGERGTHSGDEWSKFGDVGASWAVARHLQLDASVGRNLEADGAWTLGAGVSKRW